jgi:hypothetical protein
MHTQKEAPTLEQIMITGSDAYQRPPCALYQNI